MSCDQLPVTPKQNRFQWSREQRLADVMSQLWRKLTRSIKASVVKTFSCVMCKLWRVLVHQAVEDRGIHAGKVNCDVHQRLCQEAQVNAYPSVRFYTGASEARPIQVSTQSMQVFFLMMFSCISS